MTFYSHFGRILLNITSFYACVYVCAILRYIMGFLVMLKWFQISALLLEDTCIKSELNVSNKSDFRTN